MFNTLGSSFRAHRCIILLLVATYQVTRTVGIGNEDMIYGVMVRTIRASRVRTVEIPAPADRDNDNTMYVVQYLSMPRTGAVQLSITN